MRLDGIVFTPPAGLEDSTSYVYRSEAPDEKLSVELELPPGGATPAAEVVADIRESLAGFFQANVLFEAQGSTTLASEPAQFIRYQLRGDEVVFGKLIVGNPGGPGSDFVKLSWSSDSDHGGVDARVDARVDAIVASFAAAADDRDPAALLPGHERVQAGPWALDVPAQSSKPRVFIYDDPEAEIRIVLTIYKSGEPEPRLELLEAAHVAKANAKGGTVESREAGPDRVILRIRSDSDPNGESTVIFAKREVELATGQRWVGLRATAPSREAPRLLVLVDELLASIHAEEPTP